MEDYHLIVVIRDGTFKIMVQVRKALADKYFLDKHFCPLKEKIAKALIVNGYLPLNIKPEDFEDIVFGTLQAIRPRYHQLKEVRER